MIYKILCFIVPDEVGFNPLNKSTPSTQINTDKRRLFKGLPSIYIEIFFFEKLENKMST